MQKIYIKLILSIASVLFAGVAIGEDKHMHQFSKDVDAFHAVLAPLWHAQPGNERSQNVCSHAQKMENLAKEIHSGDSEMLRASLAALKIRCETNPSDIDAVFSDVHEAFHHLIMHKEHPD